MRAFVEAFKDTTVLVVGDAIQDHYVHGRAERLSPEAPVPVFIAEREERRRGGAMNVVENLEALGCGVVYSIGYSQSLKTRYMVGNHCLLRVDDDSGHEGIGEPDRARITGWMANCDAVILSDYAKGVLTPEVCRFVIHEARQWKVPVIVDPKGTDWKKYSGATVICPNHLEFEAASKVASYRDAIILEKRGAEGIRIGGRDFPTVAKQVIDVTGAGDSVVAVVAACIAVDAPIDAAAILANLAAGVVVGKLGTATCSREELLALL